MSSGAIPDSALTRFYGTPSRRATSRLLRPSVRSSFGLGVAVDYKRSMGGGQDRRQGGHRRLPERARLHVPARGKGSTGRTTAGGGVVRDPAKPAGALGGGHGVRASGCLPRQRTSLGRDPTTTPNLRPKTRPHATLYARRHARARTKCAREHTPLATHETRMCARRIRARVVSPTKLL